MPWSYETMRSMLFMSPGDYGHLVGDAQSFCFLQEKMTFQFFHRIVGRWSLSLVELQVINGSGINVFDNVSIILF